ncbi:MAG: sucrase ferredoxin [Anaerolineae bacterium]|nr:sucrase ferredoxin [Anaerolineae bacterium]
MEVSRALNEPLYGTIKASDIFFLLEYNGTYAHEAWAEADIPLAVKEKIQSYPNSHQLLMRQPGQSGESDKQMTLFVIHANSETPTIYRLDVPNYEALLAIDFDAVLRGEVVAASQEPLYAVCSNGKRDICCSKFGIALYNALTALVGDAVWQVSHIGGHRLAATMYCFPHAICYGFLSEDDASPIVQSYSTGHLLLHKLRGRAIMAKPVQAADYFLRHELSETRINALRIMTAENSDGQWDICLEIDNVTYCVQIAAAEPLQVLATTGDEQYKSMPQFTFVGYEKL